MTTLLEKDLLWHELNDRSTSFEQSMDTLHRKQTGSYYTALDLTILMMKELVDSLPLTTRERLYTKTFLEPCVGTGNFVYAYLRVCKDLGFTHEEYNELLKNIYVCDINVQALSVYQENLTMIAKEWFDIVLDQAYFDSHIGTGLLFDVDAELIQYISIEDVFSTETVKNGFDIVVTNPPYKNLKAERSHYKSDEQHAEDKEKYTTIGKLAGKHFSYSTTGVLNIYKLFVEEIVERYLTSDGVCSLLIPVSILSDKSCANLRTRILETCAVKSLRIVSENSKYVDASQALCAMMMHKGMCTESIYVDGSFDGNIQQGALVNIGDILDESTGNAILVLSDNEYKIRKQMRVHPTIKQIPYIDNLRGELDITNNKLSITTDETPYTLYRGRHIGYYRTVELPEKEYVQEAFVNATAKQRYILKSRLVCQQIANMAKKRRIAFTIVPPHSVLANSCNFVSVRPNDDGVDTHFLMGILNSTLIDWYFKLTSSNNHINNYEIDNFPIPVNFAKKNTISDLVKEYIQTQCDDILQKIDALVYEAYGIGQTGQTTEENDNEGEKFVRASVFTSEQTVITAFQNDLRQIIPGVTESEICAILDGQATAEDVCFQKKPDISKFEKRVLENIEKKYKQLYAGVVLNHTTFKLSDLDLEMIRPIPQGGSWKDIPQETVQKSKRLVRITKTGGRTTLYGRIDYEKPSYTITTYFNRPGNGTYVHPIHQRVLSVREAARFQCFPDDYLFCGNKSDLLKQVGNAVPVLLAYQLGKRIKDKTGCCTSVDLFSGAGGMTYGLKRAGIHAVIANDFAESACVTLKTNCPEIPVLFGDITKEEIKKQIIDAGVSAGADIICGGPPCQGFSLAGFRKKDDPRNELFRHFVDIVSGVKPKVIVFENVEGILSYQNGQTYANIIELFSELGYYTEGRKLLTSQYGVPQRRKRVIILCTRKDLGVMPSELYPDVLTPNLDRQVTAKETIYDLETVQCAEDAQYGSSYSSPMLQYLKHEISIDEYLSQVKDTRGILEEGMLDTEEDEDAEDVTETPEKLDQLSFIDQM